MDLMKHPPEKIEEIEYLIRKMNGIVKRKGREILNNFPITPPQFVALQWLNEEGNMTIGELSGKMYLAFSTTTDLIDRMEKSSLVERIRDQKDRRVVGIHLLDKGEKIIENVLERRREYLAEILYGMEEDQVNQIATSLQLLFGTMNQGN